ncbi:DUF4340 domain-containing protein [bacterium]|nr:DUF4340 domain-containing protein [bacterium]
MSRGNWVMLAMVAGLGGFYYWHDVVGKPARETAETESKRFFPGLKKPDVTGVKVESLKTTPFVHDIAMENGIWVLKNKEPVVLRSTSLGSAIKGAVEMQRAEDMGSDAKAAEFGLDKPSYRITLRDKRGQQFALLLGDKTPDDQGYYASLGEGKAISAINSTLPELLDGNVENVRETSPLSFESSTANKIQIESNSGPPIEVALAKPREDSGDSESDDGMEITDLNEEWKVIKPEAAEADGNKVRDLLFNWRNVKLGRFMKADEKVDFGQTVVKLTVYVDRQSQPFTLEVGSAVPGKPGLYYARRNPPSEKMVLEIKDLKLLEPKVTAVLQRHLYVFQPEDVGRLVANIEGLTIEAKKSGEEWKVKAPKIKGVDEKDQISAINDLVWEVKNMEWSEKPDPASLPKDWKERGWIEVFGQDNKSLGKVNLGPPAVGAYVKDAKGTAYLIEKDPFQRWHDLKLRLEGKGPKAPTPAPGLPPGITLPSH